ncbi:nucleoside phosphorylase domain-containing protein [Trichoderma camerunense]
MASINDYHIGWICALELEFEAAKSQLDEEHDSHMCIPQGDTNTYQLGRIGQHNVVLAVLPMGEYGTSGATLFAVNMLRSFRQIKIALMVGVGGGAPSVRHDIRLGDVVVATPLDGHSGVLQYDFGKRIQHQPFKMTRVLHQAPKLLTLAVARLRNKYDMRGRQIDEAVKRTIEQHPRLQQNYRRPPPSSDRLYRYAATHPINSDLSCADLCASDPSLIVIRPPRGSDDDTPAIHYGLIASANQVMRDAQFRDELAYERDVLCFEMEAAGLMNIIPCLAIRGICDYSDTHKNKQWQGYAAMTAAAYAKDLLSQLLVYETAAAKPIIEEIGSMAGTIFQETVSGRPGGIGYSPPIPPTSDLVGYLSRDSVDTCIARDRTHFISKTRELIQKIISANTSGGVWYNRDEVWELSRQWREYFRLHRTIPFEEELSGAPSPEMTRSYLMRMISDTRLGGDGISRQTADLYDVIAAMDYAGGWQSVDFQG